MMNYIWVGLVVIAVIAGAFTGTMEGVLNNIFDFAESAVDISLGLVGTMAFFCGLMAVMKEAGLCDALAKLIAPIMTKLFPEVPKDHPAMSTMAMWIAANVMGIGNAATPFGLKAIAELQKLNPTKDIATNAQCMMLAIGTTSVTLLPSSAIAMRAAVQTDGAAEILMPVIIATCISTATGIICSLIFQNLKGWKFENVVAKEIAAGTLELNENYEGKNPIVLPEGYVLKKNVEA